MTDDARAAAEVIEWTREVVLSFGATPAQEADAVAKVAALTEVLITNQAELLDFLLAGGRPS